MLLLLNCSRFVSNLYMQISHSDSVWLKKQLHFIPEAQCKILLIQNIIVKVKCNGKNKKLRITLFLKQSVFFWIISSSKPFEDHWYRSSCNLLKVTYKRCKFTIPMVLKHVLTRIIVAITTSLGSIMIAASYRLSSLLMRSGVVDV